MVYFCGLAFIFLIFLHRFCIPESKKSKTAKRAYLNEIFLTDY
jgi:hypothetical protein